jgi:hypothetical protein
MTEFVNFVTLLLGSVLGRRRKRRYHISAHIYCDSNSQPLMVHILVKLQWFF